MKKLHFILLVLFYSFLFKIKAQNQVLVNQNWVKTSSTPSAMFDYQASHIDASHNLIVVGNTFHSGQQENMLIRKYNSDGGLIWSKEYDGTLSGIDFATDVTTQDTNIYVTGVEGDTTLHTSSITTLKLNGSGSIIWTAKYSGSYHGYNIPARINAITGASKIYITGTSQTGATDFQMVTIMYNSSGVQQWVNTYDSVGLYDGGADLVLGASSTLTTYGVSGLSTNSGDFVTQTISATGATTGIKRVNNTNSYITKPIAMVKDVAENIYLTGVVQTSPNNTDIKVVKLDSLLNVKWAKVIDGGANGNDEVTGMKIDLKGNLVLTGFAAATDTSKSAWTFRMKDSVIIWSKKYYCPTSGKDAKGTSIDLDSLANIYVTGKVFNGINFDDLTVSYDTFGNVRWQKNFALNITSDDAGSNVIVDSGAVYINGLSKTGTTTTYHTIKYSQDKTYDAPDSTAPSPVWAYFENNGQITDTGRHQAAYVRYYTITGNPQLYVTNAALSYVFNNGRDTTRDTLQRIDFTFEASKATGNKPTSTPTYYTNEQVTPYLNYYIGGLPQYYEGVHGYQRLTAKNIYSNIDWQLYSDSDGLKYYFVVNPGGNPADIQFLYTGADSIRQDTTGIRIYSRYGSSKQLPFTAWQYTGSTATQIPITTSVVGTNDYAFTVGTYNTSLPLVIRTAQRPRAGAARSISNLNWSTYFGGTHNESTQTDMAIFSQNKYATGRTWCSDFPITTGLIADSFNNAGASVSKFNGNDFNVWSTFYGVVSGSDNQTVNPTSIRTSLGLGDAGTEAIVYLYGATGSRILPLVNIGGGAYYDSVFGGGTSDMFLARFDAASGQLRHSTYIGSNGDDFGNAMAVNQANRLLFLVGSTQGSNWHYYNSQPSSTSFYDTVGRGTIMEFDIYLHLKLSTGFGSSSLMTNNYTMQILDAAIDDSNNIVISGMTPSGFSYSGSNLPSGLPSGSYSQNYVSGTYSAAFIAKFVPHSGIYDTIFNLYYYSLLCDSSGVFGTGTEGYHVSTDHKGNMYMAGTSSCTGFPTRPTSSTCPTTNSGLFISKFSRSGALQYANLFGGSQSLNFGALPQFGWGWQKTGNIACDNTNDLYIYTQRGVTTGSLPVATPAGYYHNFTSGAGAVILELDSQQNLYWSTGFGGTANNISGQTINNAGGMVLSTNSLYISGGVFPPANPDSLPDFPIVFEAGATNYSTINTVSSNGNSLYPDGFIAKFQVVNVPINAGIDEVENNVISQNLRCYPNPSNGTFTVDLAQFSSTKTIEMIDQLGRIVFSERTDLDKIQISQSQLSKGIYFVHATDTTVNLTAKIIIY